MPELDKAALESLIRQLDAGVPREGAVVLQREDDEGGTLITANRRGYLRLGVEFLKAASAEARSEVYPSV